MSAKVFTKLAAQIQAGSTYEDDSMCLLPFTANTLNQNIDPIEDESILGLGFRDIPQKGPQHTGGSISLNVDSLSIIPILEAVFGQNSSGVFEFGTSNTKKLSLCSLCSVNAVQYSNVYPKSFKISGSSAGLIKAEVELFAVDVQARVAVGSFPASPTPPSDPFSFHEAGNLGYFRLGDSADALSSSDNMKIEEFNIDITVGHDEQFTNDGIRTLTPEWGMVVPSISGSFKLARYQDNIVEDWEDAQTPLQLEMLFYKDVSNTLKIQVPRFIINSELTDDDLTKQNVTMQIGRNGVTESYKNNNMAFASPIRITVEG